MLPENKDAFFISGTHAVPSSFKWVLYTQVQTPFDINEFVGHTVVDTHFIVAISRAEPAGHTQAVPFHVEISGQGDGGPELRNPTLIISIPLINAYPPRNPKSRKPTMALFFCR